MHLLAEISLNVMDWAWIVGLLAASFGLSIYNTRESAKSIVHYFVAGENTPWYILGTSIVATTFAVDTPLVVAGLVVTQGIAGNWFWWSVAPSGMLGVFFFAGLWRRSGCLTQAEFATLRYGRRRAVVLRLFYVIYHGVVRNAFTLGFVNLAMAGVIGLCTPLEEWQAMIICFALTIVYTALGGIKGVMWCDFLQFFLTIAAAVAIAIYAVGHVGGLDALRVDGPSPSSGVLERLTGYVPPLGSTAGWSFVIFITLYWIACTPTDCNGYAVQRLLCAKNERHAIWGYLWFNFAHYVLRSWPWIMVGMVAAVLYPREMTPAESERTYIQVIFDTAPRWLIGPALASLVAAYMSTVNTQLNWGASLLVNDLYIPYVNPGRSPRHYVYASHISTVLIGLAGFAAASVMSSIVSGWAVIASLLAGMGVVGILRWLWWRVTAWTEIGCMIGAGAATAALSVFAPQMAFPFTLLIVVPVSLAGAAIGTFAATPEPPDVLWRFLTRVRPPGPGWRHVMTSIALPPTLPAVRPAAAPGPSPGFPVSVESALSGQHHTLQRPPGSAPATTQQAGESARLTPPPIAHLGLTRPAVCWLMATAAIYCAMFGLGDLLIKSARRGALLCAVSVLLAVAVGLIYRADPGAAGSTSEGME